LIEHDTTWHFECLLGERQLGAGAVDVQDPNIADWGADCCAHQSVWPARAGADLDHQLLWFQLPTAARGAGRNSRHDRSKNHLEWWSGIDLPAFRTFVRMMEQELKQEFDAWIRAAQLAGGTGTFKLDLASNRWDFLPFGQAKKSSGR